MTDRTERHSSRHADDRTLVARAQRGDAHAFGELVTRHRDRIYGVCYRVTGNAEDAADATQIALTNAWRTIGKFRGEAAFTTWMHRIASNAALRIAEKRDRKRTDELDEVVDNRVSAANDRVDPGREVTDRMTVMEAIGKLPPVFRVAIVLREYEQLEYQEIADMLEIPVNTVRTRISRGRKALADLLADSVGTTGGGAR